MSDKLRGLREAIRNTPRKMNPAHSWSRPYNSECLCKGCESKVYHDGKIYYSLCLLHLKELELGPFFRKLPPTQD